jgi:hypothetical protein
MPVHTTPKQCRSSLIYKGKPDCKAKAKQILLTHHRHARLVHRTIFNVYHIGTRRTKLTFVTGKESLFGLLLEEGDEVVSVLGLLQATEGHLGAGNVLLGVF